MKKISIYEPELIGNEKKYLIDCIDTNWISSQGSYINKFEFYLQHMHHLFLLIPLYILISFLIPV